MDSIVRYISEEGIRLSISVTTYTIEEARYRHDLWPVVTAALGRTMTSALLLASDFKNEETVSITVDGKGPIGKIHADALSNNTIRGYVENNHVDLPLTAANKLDVGGAVGIDGQLIVTRFTGMKQNYSSQIDLISGEIGEDIAFYLFMSEQVNSTINVGVLVNPDGSVKVAGGFLVQALPEAKDEALAIVEKNINELGPLTTYLQANPNGEGLVDKIFGEIPFKKVMDHGVSFGCTCSKERFLTILGRLEEKNRIDLLKDEETELVCHYCNSAYRFPREELANYFNEHTKDTKN